MTSKPLLYTAIVTAALAAGFIGSKICTCPIAF